MSGGFEYTSAFVGEPKDSWAGEGLPLSCMSDIEHLDPEGGGRGVPAILAYGSQGDDGREPDEPGENI